MTSVYIGLALAVLFFLGILVYIGINWGKWTSKQRKYSVAGIFGLVAITAVAVLAATSMSIAYATPTELFEQIEKGQIKLGQEVKVEGEIVPGTIKTTNLGGVTDFEIKDSKNKIKVHFEGVLPDNFKPGIKAVAIGSYDGKVFKTTDVKTRCPSKYEAAAEKKEGN